MGTGSSTGERRREPQALEARALPEKEEMRTAVEGIAAAAIGYGIGLLAVAVLNLCAPPGFTDVYNDGIAYRVLAGQFLFIYIVLRVKGFRFAA